MSGKNIIFDDKNIRKRDFHKSKKLFNIDDIDANKVLVSKKNHMGQISKLNISLDIMTMKNRPLCVKLPQMIGYVKCFDNNKAMLFKAIDNKLLKKYKVAGEKQQFNEYKIYSETFYSNNDK